MLQQSVQSGPNKAQAAFNTNSVSPPGSVNNSSDARHRQTWFPIVTLAVLLNFFLWVGMLYTIFEARAYHNERKPYLAISWIIILIPFVAAAIILFTPFPGLLKSAREAFILRQPARYHFDLLILANALTCFALVTMYLYVSAIPQYNRPVWKTDLDFSLNLHIPSISILLPTSMNMVSQDSLRAYVEYNGTKHQFPSKAISRLDNFRNSYTAVAFDSSQLDAIDFTTIQDLIHVELDVNFNSSIASYASLMTYFEIYDSRLSLDTVYACEIANYPRMAAFATSEYNIVAEHIIDRYGLVVAPSSTEACGKTYHGLLTEKKIPYTAYSWNLESSVPTTSNFTSCDVSQDADARCTMALEFSFGTHLIHTYESQPGISKLEIWLNAGAITGAVQFFAWFAEILLLRGASPIG